MRFFNRESKGTPTGGRFKASARREARVSLAGRAPVRTRLVEARHLLPEWVIAEADGRRLTIVSGPHRSPTGHGVSYETVDADSGEEATKTFAKTELVDIDSNGPKQTKTYFAGPGPRYAPGYEPSGSFANGSSTVDYAYPPGDERPAAAVPCPTCGGRKTVRVNMGFGETHVGPCPTCADGRAPTHAHAL